MSISLPPPIAAYFAAESDDAAALSALFTRDAVVKDEGETHRGTAAIRDWKAGASRKYSYSITPVAVAEADGKIVVTCHLVGDFPGGEVDLRHFFEIDGDKIAFLEIIP